MNLTQSRLYDFTQLFNKINTTKTMPRIEVRLDKDYKKVVEELRKADNVAVDLLMCCTTIRHMVESPNIEGLRLKFGDQVISLRKSNFNKSLVIYV